MLQPYISYPDMKNVYSIQITNLRHKDDHITPKKYKYSKTFLQIETMTDCFFS